MYTQIIEVAFVQCLESGLGDAIEILKYFGRWAREVKIFGQGRLNDF